MRFLKKLIILAFIVSIGISYKLGHFDNFINQVMGKKPIPENNISTSPANAVLTAHDITIQALSDSESILHFTLKNNSNKTHELVNIETEIGNNVQFFENFTKENKTALIEVFGVPVEGFNIVKLNSERHFAKIINQNFSPKSGSDISIKLIFSDGTEKNTLAKVK